MKTMRVVFLRCSCLASLTLIALFGLARSEGALLVRELFDGLSGTLDGAGNDPSSVGFSAPWAANPTSWNAMNALRLANDFNVDLALTNIPPWQLGAGDANRGGVWWNSTAYDSDCWAMRPLASACRLNLGVDAVYYLTFNLVYRDGDSLGFGFATTSDGLAYDFLSVGVNWNWTSWNSDASAKRLAVARGASIAEWPGVSGATAYSSVQFINDLAYVVLVKITARASDNDTVQAAFFHPSRPGHSMLPAHEDEVSWELTDTFMDDHTYDMLVAFINGQSLWADLDAFRMGTSYGDVVQLAPLISRQPSPSPGNTVYAGNSVILEVGVTGGVPEPYSYQWWKGSSPIPNATNAVFSLGTTSAADSGNYFVVVTNAYGSVTSETSTITVLPAISYGTALSFDGVDDYVSVSPATYFAGDLTVEAWVYVRSYGWWSRVLDFGNGQLQDNVVLSFSDGSTGRPSFGVARGGVGQSLTAPVQVPLNQWVHLAATLTMGNSNATLYLNGVAVANGLVQPPAAVSRSKNYIGHSNWPSEPGYADAVFDEVRIWNIARSAEEIQATMHQPLVGSERGLVSYFRFDEGSGIAAFPTPPFEPGRHAEEPAAAGAVVVVAPAHGQPLQSVHE